jgi:hypothetical protein
MIFFGIDYSASRLARKKIWISECEMQKRNLLIKDTYCLEEISNKFTLQNCNTYIYDLIEKNKNSIFGFDFSFSIPEFFFKDSSWEDFIFSFKKRWKTADDFKKDLLNKSNGKELKRDTEIESKVPFSTYNLWIYKQTYYGISEIIYPLLKSKICNIIPFNKLEKDIPSIMETCPASFLKFISKKNDLSKHYKGKKKENFENRKLILNILERDFFLVYKSIHLKNKILSDTEGDSLDSLLCVICAMKGFSNLHTIMKSLKIKNEGYVFY